MSRKHRDYHHKQRQNTKQRVNHYVRSDEPEEGFLYGEAKGGGPSYSKMLGEVQYSSVSKGSDRMPGTCNIRDCIFYSNGKCTSEAVRCEYEPR